MIALLLVAGNAEHLAVADFRLAALAPRNDMVCMHILEILLLAAHGTPMTLLLIHGHGRGLIKLPGLQELLITLQKILINARLLHDLLVGHQLPHLLLHPYRVQIIVPMLVIQQTPCYALHRFTRNRPKHMLHPIEHGFEIGPQVISVCIIAMILHELDYGVLARKAFGRGFPTEDGLQIVLPDIIALHVLAIVPMRGTIPPGEGRLCVRQP